MRLVSTTFAQHSMRLIGEVPGPPGQLSFHGGAQSVDGMMTCAKRNSGWWRNDQQQGFAYQMFGIGVHVKEKATCFCFEADCGL